MRLGTPLMLVFFALGQFAWGQGCCSGGAPLAGSLGLQPLKKGEFLLELAFRHNHLNDLMIEKEVLDDKRLTRVVQSSLLRAHYALNDKLTLALILPWLRQREGLTGTTVQTTADGPGDISFMVQYELLSRGDWVAIGGLGAKAPTGITTLSGIAGIPLNPNIQPGTGAWEGVGGFFLRKNKIFRPTMAAELVGSFRLMGTGNRFDGQQKYRFGDERQLYLGLSDQFFVKKVLFDLSLGIRFRNTSDDLADEVEVPNTGGNWLYLAPGINFHLNPRISWATGINYPIYRSLTGTQLTTSWTIQTGISWKIRSAQNIVSVPNP